MKSVSVSKPALGRAALFSAPVIIALLALNSDFSNAAIDPPARSTQFERVQFADVIETAQPAVVQITVVKSQTGPRNGFDRPRPPSMGPGGGAFEEFLRRFGPEFLPAPGPAQRGPQATGMGSGFIIDADGYIVTNNHVVDQASSITVTLTDGRELEATLVGADAHTDLAVLKVDAQNLTAVQFGDSDKTRVGDSVVAIGNPFGFGGSVTAGIISARGRDIRSGPYDDYFQIDAPINSGNSGGPILDANGQVIGVNTAIFSPNGGNIGIGFAIPASEAARIVDDIRTNGGVTRGWLGVQIQGINEDVAAALNLDQRAGALVAEVVSNGPAARAGIRAGDVITAFAGASIRQPRDLSRAVARTEPGEKATITIVRQAREKKLSAVIDRNETTSAPRLGQAPGGDGDNQDTQDTLGLGLALGSLSDQTRRQMRLDHDVEGAVVLGIKNGSAAESGGIRPGDVIVQIDQKDVRDAEDAESALARAVREKRPSIVLIRRGQEQFFATMKVA